MTASDIPATDQAAGRGAVLQDLLARGLVDEAAAARAGAIARRTGQPIEAVLNQIGVLSDDDLASAYAAATGCAVWDPDAEPFGGDAPLHGVSVDFLRRHRMAPLKDDDGGQLICAVCDPFDRVGLDGLAFAVGRPLNLRVARFREWRRAFDVAYPTAAPHTVDERRLARDVDQVTDIGADSGGARLLSAVLEQALAQGASDIHFEPRRHDLCIRLRLDGRLVDQSTHAADLAAPVVSRIKVLAQLDVGERRLPQDGRSSFVVQGESVDVRVAVAPTVFGEAAVLRLLDRRAAPLDLPGLGLDGAVCDVLSAASRMAHGLFLVSGPTGSGKTTTLYALLATLRGSQKKILSVEDPVERHFEHVSQVQAAPHIGLTFASALRAFLRHDPDVILVGEIRDAETASVAVQAAMTGHLVLASIHANDAVATVSRLLDMRVEPYQLSGAFRGASAQRLVRRLCPGCRRARTPTADERALFRRLTLVEPEALFEPTGCANCNGLGFSKRIAVAEAFLADEEFQRAVAGREDLGDLRARSDLLGRRRMEADGAVKAAAGLTTLAEVLAATGG